MSAATLTATIRAGIEAIDGEDELVERALAALSVLEQQHADAEKERDEWKRRYVTADKAVTAALDGVNLIEGKRKAAEAALQAAHDALEKIANTPFEHAFHAPRIAREMKGVARAALAAASAAAEGDET